MKTLLTLSLLLLAVATGEAGTLPAGSGAISLECKYHDLMSNEWIPCTVEQERNLRSDCAARMEQAMRAMEPFTNRPATNPEGQWWVQYGQAVQLWNAVKRECWREP